MLINYKQKTPTKRFASKMLRPKNHGRPSKALSFLLPKRSGRLNGTITVQDQGGRHKRLYRMIDFRRDKLGVVGEVKAFEYDPNRNVNIALVVYSDGEKRYILAPKELKLNDSVISDKKAEVKVGNALMLKNIPIGTVLHNVELTPGKGGQLGRSAGVGIILQAKEGSYGHLKLPSGEVRMVPLESFASVGALGNEEAKNINLGKAGRSRHMGIRPHVRGTAMDPDSHPHGGGEGRSGVGRKKPMTRYGKPAVGKTRKKNKWTDKYILKRRK
ncbi:50S ribosomal protein L2 [Candidatus Daviesbacteria bacterium]|nr:50S ribosomal protein L2 [Candidatus Daviesbacteria bacterium]